MAIQLLISVRVAENDTAGWKAAGGEILPTYRFLDHANIVVGTRLNQMLRRSPTAEDDHMEEVG